MIINAYVIFDKAAKMYNKPFYFHNDVIALRGATDLVSSPGTDIYNNPSDFTMFKLGTYDDETAAFVLDEQMPIICRFHELNPNTRIEDSELPQEQQA